jgi:tetratricopeptide (TPR) repeat protein
MIDTLYERAAVLYQQNRYQQAMESLEQAIALDPNHVACLHLLAEIKLAMDEPKQAKTIIDSAIAITPYADYLFATKARIMIDVERYDEAEQLLKQAIQLNPNDSYHFAMLAQISLSRKRYQEAENLSDKALSLAPDNVLALNTKSTAQLKLNKKTEAEETMRGALGENPEDSYTHATYGWNQLELGNHARALEHFKEALKFNPNNPYAQSGMVQALQAQYFIYRWFLKYQFWIGNMAAKYQWGFIIGFYLFTRVLDYVGSAIPILEPFLTPIVILLGLIALSTWIIGPLSQLLFSTNKYAQHLLSTKEKRASIYTGIWAVMFLLGLATYFVTDSVLFLAISGYCLILIIPWSMFYLPTKPKLMLPLASLIMTVIACIAVYETISTGAVFNLFSTSFLFAFVAFQFFVNAVVIKRDNI